MVFRKIIFIYYEDYTKPINRLQILGNLQNLFNEASGIYS